MVTSMVRDPSLASDGRAKIQWVDPRMPVLARIEEELVRSGVLQDVPVALCLHLEAKTARLILALKEAGAHLSVCGSNPLSTQDDVAAAVAEAGVNVYAWHGATEEEDHRFLDMALGIEPRFVIDDGADLVALLHADRRDLLPNVQGAAEETTTGLNRMRAMHREGILKFPVLAVNDARCKYLFDNRYGTGQSVWDGIMRTTNLVVAGKQVVVVGYGWCGKGVAMRAQGLGARVVVTEIDPVAANEALMDGFSVMPLIDAAREADVVITVTGCAQAVTVEHFEAMKDGALLANAGHFDVEIDKPGLRNLSRTSSSVRGGVEEYTLKDGRRLYLLAEGRLVNLAAGDGHPAEIMDMSFALQALALEHLVRHARDMGPGVYPLGRELDERVARLRLEALGVGIDTLTPEQERYLVGWQ